MKKILIQLSFIFIGAIILILSISFSYNLLIKKSDSPEILIGQVWKTTRHADNPYEETVVYLDSIIDVKHSYVLYVRDGKDTMNRSKHWFVVNSELIKH